MKGLVLWLARLLPRGWSRVLFWAAKRYPELSRCKVSLKLAPGTAFFVDLGQSVCLPLFKWGCYPHQMLEDTLAPSLLRRGEVVFDVGANIGYTAALFSRAVGPKGHVYAFEPARRCLVMLKDNAAPLENVTVVGAGVSEKSGTMVFEEQATLDTSRLAPDQTGQEISEKAYAVPVISLDDYVAAGSARAPHFIKVDVEGHEPSVFRGAARLLLENPPILLFEALDEASLRECTRTLESIAPGIFRTFTFAPGGRLIEAGAGVVSHVNNYLTVPPWAIERIAPLLQGAPAQEQAGAP